MPGPPMPSVHRFSVRALVTVDVTARLAARDRDAAATAIGDLVVRAGGTLLARRPDPGVPGGEVMELLVPRLAYLAVVSELTRLGRCVADRATVDLPDPVRMVVHVTE
jgi:hypothetical protein